MTAGVVPGRQLSEKSAQIWRAVAGAGKRGLSRAEIGDRFQGVIDADPIDVSLMSLRASRYLSYHGEQRFGRWVLTLECRLPKNETRPSWLFEAVDEDDDVVAGKENAAQPADLRLLAASSSVFHQGDKPFTASVGSSKAPCKSAATRQPAIAAVDEPVSAWTIGDAARARQVVTSEQVADCGVSGDEKRALLDEVAAEAPRLVQVQVQQPPKREFVCSLDSDGDLLIYASGDELRLDAKHVRRLVDYLDRINAGDWLRVCEAQS